MNAREKILNAVRLNQTEPLPLPELDHYEQKNSDHLQHFIAVLTAIGGTAHVVESAADMIAILNKQFPLAERKLAINKEWNDYATIFAAIQDPHDLKDVDIAIIDAHFGVAENGCVWVTENQMGLRAFPFICQHLVAVIKAKDIVPTMLEAYEKIGLDLYTFGTFIAGPSKTADIEQSLVLGAHGPKTMTVFLKCEV